jgi:hypothetical protein
VIDALKLIGGPGSLPFLLTSILLGLGLLAFTRRFRKLGGVLVMGVLAMYIVLALPVVGHAIANRLPAIPPEPTRQVATLIVLDGDNRRGRVRLMRQVIATDHPTTVWILGDRWILNALEEAGVRRDTFRFDAGARTTRAQIDQVSGIGQRATPPVAVIASRLQAPRVVALLQSREPQVAVLASPIDEEPARSGIEQFIPAYLALRLSRDAIYEHAALAYYRWRGFIPS